MLINDKDNIMDKQRLEHHEVQKEVYSKEYVKEYLLNIFQNRRTKKPFQVYKKIVKFYEQYPETIKEVVKNICKLGYWKDCFLLLLAAKALTRNNTVQKLDEFNSFTYNFLIDTLDADVINFKKNQNITTLAKWLPREDSSFDRKLDFIDTFMNIACPDMTNVFSKRAKYRKTLTTLNKRIGTAEVKMCEKNPTEIDFHMIGPICIKNNKDRLLTNDICKEKIKEALFLRYNEMNLWKLMKIIYYQKLHELDQIIIEKVWKRNYDRYIRDLQRSVGIDVTNSQLLIDLSSSIFSNKLIYFIVGVILLTLEKLENINKNNKVFIIGRTRPLVFNDTNIFNISKMIIQYCTPFKNDKTYEFDNGQNLIIIAHEPVNLINNNNNNKTFWHITNDSPCVIINNVITGVPYRDVNVCNALIKNIIDKSPELVQSESKMMCYIHAIILLIFVIVICTYFRS